MDDTDRDPEPPARIEQRRAEKAELDRQFRERQAELDRKHDADPLDGAPETWDDLHIGEEPPESRDVFDGLFL